MGTSTPTRRRGTIQLGGIQLLAVMVALMWAIELINKIDGQGLNQDGIEPRNVDHLWAIFTAPFLHAGFQHLESNTVPFVFMGVIIALKGAKRLALVTIIVILVSGLGTWLIAPGNENIVGASGVVFGYATYLFTRGVFNRDVLELLVAVVVGVVWGAALLASIVPQAGISWQDHACGAIGGVVAAALLSRERKPTSGAAGPAGGARLAAGP